MAEQSRVVQSRQQREIRLAAEFAAKEFPHARTFSQARVGSIQSRARFADLSAGEVALLGNVRRRTDVIAITSSEVVIIECYMTPELGKVSQLMAYVRLFPLTPEFEEFRNLPIRGIIVGPVRDPILDEIARSVGFTVVIFQPPWIVEHLKTFAGRHTRDRSSEDFG